jgi:glutathione synthase/RimK-type ligase-like ATP-grasp enzyme
MMRSVAYVSYRYKGHLVKSTDYSRIELILSQSHKQNLALEAVAWSDSLNWEKYSLIVLDTFYGIYLSEYRNQFLQWLDIINEQNVWNPVAAVRWNFDKTYLKSLIDRGVRVVPSYWISSQNPIYLQDIADKYQCKKIVVKPSQGAGGYGVKLFAPKDQSQFEIYIKSEPDLLHGEIIVQPYMEEIVTSGEISLIFIRTLHGDMQFSHAIRKTPNSGNFKVQKGTIEFFFPSQEIISSAKKVIEIIIDEVGIELLHIRVDCIILSNNELVVMETEVIGPSRHLIFAPINKVKHYINMLKHLANR